MYHRRKRSVLLQGSLSKAALLRLVSLESWLMWELDVQDQKHSRLRVD